MDITNKEPIIIDSEEQEIVNEEETSLVTCKPSLNDESLALIEKIIAE